MAMQTWKAANVTPKVITDASSYTGAAYIFVDDKKGDNAIIIAPGAAAQFSKDDIAQNARLIAGADVFMTQLEQPIEVAKIGLEVARNSGKITILNPAPALALERDVFGLCDFITPNETEAEALTGVTVKTSKDAENAAEALVYLGVKTPVITMGEQGVYLHGYGVIPAFNFGPVVETTGAGDAFNGGFATALSEGKSPEEAVRFGCATASISVTRAGTAHAMPTREEVEKLLGS